MLHIFHAAIFDKKLQKMPYEFYRWVEAIEKQLVVNPYVGDQLQVPWLREKKLGKFRVYYLIYDDLNAVYMVNISGKKNQQQVIDTVLLLLDIYKSEVRNLVRR